MQNKLILTYNKKKINVPAPVTAPAPAPTAKAAVMTMNRNIRQTISMRTIIQLPASNCSSCGN